MRRCLHEWASGHSRAPDHPHPSPLPSRERGSDPLPGPCWWGFASFSSRERGPDPRRSGKGCSRTAPTTISIRAATTMSFRAQRGISSAGRESQRLRPPRAGQNRGGSCAPRTCSWALDSRPVSSTGQALRGNDGFGSDSLPGNTDAPGNTSRTLDSGFRGSLHDWSSPCSPAPNPPHPNPLPSRERGPDAKRAGKCSSRAATDLSFRAQRGISSAGSEPQRLRPPRAGQNRGGSSAPRTCSWALDSRPVSSTGQALRGNDGFGSDSLRGHTDTPGNTSRTLESGFRGSLHDWSSPCSPVPNPPHPNPLPSRERGPNPLVGLRHRGCARVSFRRNDGYAGSS